MTSPSQQHECGGCAGMQEMLHATCRALRLISETESQTQRLMSEFNNMQSDFESMHYRCGQALQTERHLMQRIFALEKSNRENKLRSRRKTELLKRKFEDQVEELRRQRDHLRAQLAALNADNPQAP